jgi:TatD DNase family protein
MAFINIHSHNLVNNSETTTLFNCFPPSELPNNDFSVGIHPWYVHPQQWEQQLLSISQRLKHPQCLALGECGLDPFADAPLALQERVFIAQVQLSETHQKPLIIHCVKAFPRLLALKKQLRPQQTWIVHGFTKSEQLAMTLLQHGCYLSFGAALYHHPKLQEFLPRIPLDKIFLETDASTYTIQNIYARFAELKNESISLIEAEISKNFKRVFSL